MRLGAQTCNPNIAETYSAGRLEIAANELVWGTRLIARSALIIHETNLGVCRLLERLRALRWG